MTNNNYVIIGASAAGINACKKLRELDKNANITLISKDENVYSRCMLHHVISGHRTLESINFIEDNFMEVNNINWISGHVVNDIDTELKIVEMDGIIVNYDKLLIASGASSFIPPIKNLREGNFVYSLRNIDDVEQIIDKAKTSKKVAIIGAGLVGIDALSGLLEYKNLEISVVYMEPNILNLQLDPPLSKVYEEEFVKAGVKLYPNSAVKEIVLDDNDNAKSILLGDGNVVECDMIIVATGVVPNATFIDDSGIEYNRGIVINDKCETNKKDVYAAGDVVGKNAIWPLAVKQGIVAAYNMVGLEKEIDDKFMLKNSMNFMGIPTVSIGLCNPQDDSYEVMTRCGKDYYKKIVYKDNKICGAAIQGDISYTGVLTYLIKHQVEVCDIEKRAFDIGYGDFFEMKENGEFCYSV